MAGVFQFHAQFNCVGNVPYYNVNLSSNPNATLSFPINIPPSGYGECCGLPLNQNCITFSITLHPNSLGVIFYIAGASGSATIRYQNCNSPVYNVGQSICLNNVGPHEFSFCRPGSTDYTIYVSSIPSPNVVGPLVTNENCPIGLSVLGLQENTISWNSISPGNPGAQNHLLSCLANCDSTLLSPLVGSPNLLNYQVCGTPLASSCIGLGAFCDTVQITVNPAPVITINPINPNFCSGLPSGTVNASVSGGTPPFNYTWSGPNMLSGQSTLNLSVGSSGTYTLQLDDATNCPLVSQSTVVNFLNPLQNSFSSVAPICHGQSNGQISVATTGGLPPYTYTWSNGLSGNQLQNLPAGSYTVTLTDQAGCIRIDTVVLLDPPPMAVNLNVTSNYNGQAISCYGASDAGLLALVSGGTPGYSYIWSNGAFSNNISGLSAGTYGITITDNNNCQVSDSITIANPTALIAQVVPTTNFAGWNISCNGAQDGAISLTLTGGLPSYTVLWNNGSNSLNPGNLSAGTYTAIVSDINGCLDTASIVLSEPPLLLASATVISNYNGQEISCNGAQDGAILGFATGGTPGYSYLWNNGINIPNLTSLSAGQYSLTVTDSNGCSSNTIVQLSEPPQLQVAAAVTSNYNGQAITCFGASDASLFATAVGGNPGYTFTWSNGMQGASVNGLAAGSYQVLVVDVNACVDTTTVLVNQPSSIALSLSVNSNYNGSPISCFGSSDGALSLTVSGGTPSYSYLWSNGSVNQNLLNIPTGNYAVTVTDLNGCAGTDSINLGQPNPLTSSATVISNYNGYGVSCFGSNNGSAVVQFLGGVPSYQLLWSNNFLGDTLSNASAGTYTVWVTDGNGCTDSATVVINEPTAVTVNVAITSNFNGQPLSCYGSNDGSLTTVAVGGVAPYSYVWSNGITGNNLGNIGAGTYTVQATDQNGCFDSISATLLNPAPSQLSISSLVQSVCSGDSTAVFQLSSTVGQQIFWFVSDSLNVNGIFPLQGNGVSPITVPSFLPVNNTSNVGSIAITAYAACSNDTLVHVINVNPQTNVELDTAQYTTCSGQSITILPQSNPSGGQYIWTAIPSQGISGYSNGVGDTIIQTLFNDGLFSGTVLYWVAMSNVQCAGDSLQFQITVVPQNDLDSLIDFAVCSSSTVNEISLGANSPGSQFTWFNSQPNIGLNASGTGNIPSFVCSNGNSTNPLTALLVVQANDGICPMAVDSFFITVHPLPNFSSIIFPSHGLDCQTGVAEIQGVTNANYPIYAWTGPGIISGANSNSLFVNQAGIYELTLLDSITLCESIYNVNISAPSPLLFSGISVLNARCYGENNGSISIAVNSGEVAFSWIPNLSDSSSIVGLPAGNYYVEISDSLGCTLDTALTVAQPDSIVIDFNVLVSPECGENNGQLQAIAFGGTAPYSYFWNHGINTSLVANAMQGTYIVEVIDANGCSQLDTVPLDCTPLTPLVIPQFISANGDNLNDFWYFQNVEQYPDLEVKVFNRWGTLVYEARPYQNDWNGHYKGTHPNPLPAATYFYLVDTHKNSQEILQGYLEIQP
jgi:gliding motility-associated-like protein